MMRQTFFGVLGWLPFREVIALRRRSSSCAFAASLQGDSVLGNIKLEASMPGRQVVACCKGFSLLYSRNNTVNIQENIFLP